MVRGDIARSQRRTIELLRDLLQEALDFGVDFDLGERICEALEALGVEDDPIVDYHAIPATPETVHGLWPLD